MGFVPVVINEHSASDIETENVTRLRARLIPLSGKFPIDSFRREHGTVSEPFPVDQDAGVVGSGRMKFPLVGIGPR